MPPERSTRIERPALEEFIRLSSNPNSPWGMADVDTIAICQYALSLESLVERQRKALEEIVAEYSQCASYRADQMFMIAKRALGETE